MNELARQLGLVKEILGLSPNAEQDVRKSSGPPSQVGLTKPPTKAVACNPRNLRAVIDSDILPGAAMLSTPHLPIEYRPDSYANLLLEGS